MALPAIKDRPDGDLALFDQILDSFFEWPLPAVRIPAVAAPMDLYEKKRQVRARAGNTGL
jgi:hypothetical protein